MDLYKLQASGEANLLISPYSIQTALTMTFAGADGDTRAEMQRVLHLPADDSAVHASFQNLATELVALRNRSMEWVKQSKESGGPSTSIELNVANRLFAQRGYPIRPTFLALVKDSYSAPVEEMDFAKAPESARLAINRWVETETKDRIRDLIPTGVLTPDERLVLVNALYLRAPWAVQFNESVTREERFLVHGRDSVGVPTMSDKSSLGYDKRDGFQVVSRSYYGGELQFIILLPDDPNGLPAVERALNPQMLQECTQLKQREVILHLPKFRIEPPTLRIGDNLKALGMKTAFDDPRGSANFDRMAPRKPNDYLYIGAVLHKTFLALDEKGSEAAAATAVAMARGSRDSGAETGAPRSACRSAIRIRHPARAQRRVPVSWARDRSALTLCLPSEAQWKFPAYETLLAHFHPRGHRLGRAGG